MEVYMDGSIRMYSLQTTHQKKARRSSAYLFHYPEIQVLIIMCMNVPHVFRVAGDTAHVQTPPKIIKNPGIKLFQATFHSSYPTVSPQPCQLARARFGQMLQVGGSFAFRSQAAVVDKRSP